MVWWSDQLRYLPARGGTSPTPASFPRVVFQSVWATLSGSTPAACHQADSFPTRWTSRWCTRQSGTVNSSLAYVAPAIAGRSAGASSDRRLRDPINWGPGRRGGSVGEIGCIDVVCLRLGERRGKRRDRLTRSGHGRPPSREDRSSQRLPSNVWHARHARSLPSHRRASKL